MKIDRVHDLVNPPRRSPGVGPAQRNKGVARRAKELRREEAVARAELNGPAVAHLCGHYHSIPVGERQCGSPSFDTHNPSA